MLLSEKVRLAHIGSYKRDVRVSPTMGKYSRRKTAHSRTRLGVKLEAIVGIIDYHLPI